jgi:prepilin-type N-terminal cleavage/methylation domain-containing protein
MKEAHDRKCLSRPCGGFSLIELLLVAAVGGLVFTAGALAFSVVSKNHRSSVAFQEVTLPAGVGENF